MMMRSTAVSSAASPRKPIAKWNSAIARNVRGRLVIAWCICRGMCTGNSESLSSEPQLEGLDRRNAGVIPELSKMEILAPDRLNSLCTLRISPPILRQDFTPRISYSLYSVSIMDLSAGIITVNTLVALNIAVLLFLRTWRR
jgi:hypothetical protein